MEPRIALCQLAPRAIEDLDVALSQTAELVPQLLYARIAVLARHGRHADVAATAEKLAELKPKGAPSLYDAACGYSLCVAAVAAGKKPEQLSTDEAALREKYAARAIELMRQAVQGGWTNVEHMKKDTDLDPLRERPDFQKLLADLEHSSS